MALFSVIGIVTDIDSASVRHGKKEYHSFGFMGLESEEITVFTESICSVAIEPTWLVVGSVIVLGVEGIIIDIPAKFMGFNLIVRFIKKCSDQKARHMGFSDLIEKVRRYHKSKHNS